MPRPTSLGVPCDICGKDEYWDNRESKKNAKAPDWVCASKECPGKDGYKFGRWERDRAKWGNGSHKAAAKVPATSPSGHEDHAIRGGRITGDDTTPDERGERVYTWPALSYTYSKLYEAVFKVVRAHTPEELHVDQNAVQAGVATLLIQGEKAHIPLLHPRKATVKDVQKPAPKKPDTSAGLDEFPEALEEDFEPWP